MDKETIIKKLTEEGYTTNFTLEKDCLYCEDTGTEYMLKSFTVDMELVFTEEGIEKKIRAVSSEEFGLKGYYLY